MVISVDAVADIVHIAGDTTQFDVMAAVAQGFKYPSGPCGDLGDFDTELVKEFVEAMAREMGLTIHLRMLAGENSHHIIEAVFKGMGRALRQACAIEKEYADEIPSTKGVL